MKEHVWEFVMWFGWWALIAAFLWFVAAPWFMFLWFVAAPWFIVRMGWHEQVIEREVSWPDGAVHISYERPTLVTLWQTRKCGESLRQYVDARHKTHHVVYTRITVRDPATRQRLLKGEKT